MTAPQGDPQDPQHPQHPQDRHGTSAYPPPPPWPARPGRRRATALVAVASAVTGAVLGVGVAAPVAWVVAESAAVDSEVGDHLVPGGADRPQAEGAMPEWGAGRSPAFPGASDGAAFEDATAEEATGVVVIEVAAADRRGAGTGWVLEQSGLVVTNYHVVAGSSEVTATGGSGESWDAEVVGHDASADVALLQLDDAEGLPTVSLDDDGDPTVGDEVTAVGNAAGQGRLSASDGCVVSLEEDIRTANPGTRSTSPLTGLIRSDARVVPGFSGGVMLDDEGEVVGITTAASAGGGPAESYSVPIEDALDVVDRIRAGDESGSVQIGPGAYLGVSVAGSGGLHVAEVQPGTPAAEAGLTAGSSIAGLAEHGLRDFADLRRALAGFEPGDRTTISWIDPSGARQQATITLGESPRN